MKKRMGMEENGEKKNDSIIWIEREIKRKRITKENSDEKGESFH